MTEGDEGDFGGAVDTYGSSTANALVYIERLGGMVVPACGLAEHKVGEGVPEDAHLSCVGVSAESQGYGCLVHNLCHPLRGVMRKEYAETVRALQRLREVAAVDCAETLSITRRIIHPHYGEGLYFRGVAGAAFYRNVLITKKLPSDGVALEGGKAFHLGETLLLGEARIDEQVVVAQDADHAIGGTKTAENIDIGLRFCHALRDKVAREADEVGLQGIDGVHDMLQCRRAVVESRKVQVADMYYFVSVEGYGEFAARIVGVVHPQAEPPPEEAVRHHQPCRKDKGKCRPTKGGVRRCGLVAKARYRIPNAENKVRQDARQHSEKEHHYQGHDKNLHIQLHLFAQ